MSIVEVATNSSHSCTNKHDRNQPEIETPLSLSSQCNTQKKTIDSLFIPLRTSKTEMYLRIKPTGSMNVDEPDVYTIVNPTTLLTKSTSFEGNGRHLRYARSCDNSKRHVFTKIFGSQTSQTEIFEQSIKHRVLEFLDGKSSTIMTYGTRDSGKTYTIYGTTMSPGIIPRSIELIFSTVNCTLTPWYKLTCQDTVYNLDESARISETRRKARLLNRRSIDMNEISLEARISLENSQLSDTISSVEEREQSNGESMHAIWLSFVEIYNENIYDLLDDTETQSPLKLITDNEGRTYIGNLQRVYATTALEACQILLAGQSRMTTRTTLSNPRSSRSHTIFAINLLRYQKDHAADEVTLSTLSFCDLAGSMQFKAQQNKLYIREASNINNSLLVLGRCLKAVSQDHQMAPFRESKLTRIFQNALSGRQDLILIVNVVFTSSLFAETQNTLNTFCAVTRRLLNDPQKKSERSECEYEKIIDNPAANNSDIMASSSVVEISSDRTRMMEIMNDENTKDNILQRKYVIRQELTDHYSHMFDELEASYKQFTEEIENEGQNLLKWPVRQTGRFYKERYIDNLMGHKKRKRGDSGDYVDGNYALYEELEAENVQITSKVTALKEAVKKLRKDNKMILCEKNKCNFELAFVTEELKKFRELTQTEIRKWSGNNDDDDLENDAVCLMNRLKQLMDKQVMRNEQQLDNMNECIREMKNKDADVTSKVVVLEEELSKTVNLLDDALAKTRRLENDYLYREAYIDTLKSHINMQEQKLTELQLQLQNVKNQDATDTKCDRSTNISFDDCTTDSFLDDSSDLAFHTAQDVSQISYVNTSTVDQQEFNDSTIISPTLLVTQTHAESPEKVNIESDLDRSDFYEDTGNLYHVSMSPVLRPSDKSSSSKDDSGISSGLGNESRRSVSIPESDEKYTQTCEETNNSYTTLKENFEQLKQMDNENLQVVELSKILEIIGNVICALNEAACLNERKITQYERELLDKGGVLEYLTGEREEITSRCNSLFKMIEDKMQGYKREVMELTDRLTDTKENESEASKCVERYLELSKSLNVQLSLMRVQLDKVSSKCVNEHLPRIENLEEEVLRKTLQINVLDERLAQAQQTFVKSHELFEKLDDFEIILNKWQRDRNEIHRQLYECSEFLLNLEDKLQKLTVKITKNENKVTLLKTEIHNITDLNVAYNENACHLTEQIVDVCENIDSVKKNLQCYEELCENLENIVNREIDDFKIRLSDVKNKTTLLNDMFQAQIDNHDGSAHWNVQLPDKEEREMIQFNDNRDNTVTERYETSMTDSPYEIDEKGERLGLTQRNNSDNLTKSLITNEGSLYEVAEFVEKFSENQGESKDFLENHEYECSSSTNVNACTMFSHMHEETDMLSDQSEDSTTSFNEKNITDANYCQTEEDSVTSNTYASPCEADSSETEDDLNTKLLDIKNKKKISGWMKIRRIHGKTALSQFTDDKYIDVDSYSETE